MSESDIGLTSLLGVERAALADLVETLAARRLTVATAESLTAGLLAAVITEIPGASAVLRGGVVCYATDLKADLLGVDAELLARVGPVDPTVAEQLARGAARVCRADIGLGLTGVAGPDPQGGHAPGTVFVSRFYLGRAVVRTVPVGAGGRAEIRAAAIRCALDLLREAASGNN